MPVYRRLDDQTYDEIMQRAKGRLPWLCPVWTDHNAHDPGITLLELMAWYKELQQYHMDQLTPALRRRLLALAGITPLPERAAGVLLELDLEGPARLPDARLTNTQEMVFELAEAVPEKRLALKAVAVAQGARRQDITPLLQGGPAFRPFAFAGREDTRLCLGFSGKPEQALRLWFEIALSERGGRNAPAEDSIPPRALEWEFEGCGTAAPGADETWNLSWSGFVTLPVPSGWAPGQDGLYWLFLRQTDPGCEEQVRLSGIFAGRYRAEQRESRAREHRFRISDRPGRSVLLRSAQAKDAELAVFLRRPEGWEQISAFQRQWTAGGLRLKLDGSGAARDGQENLLVACLDPIRGRELLFDAKGLPGERFYLNPDGRTVLTGRLRLMCLTLEADGAVRPAPWELTEDLSLCSPRDRVFAYDAARECLVFGDGAHGAIPSPGKGAVMVTELVLSRCGSGNLPADAGLWFEADRTPVRNGAASGGADAETPDAARGRLLRRLEHTVKCVSAADYEQCAMETPGLRVAGAKALPGFDGRTGHGARRPAFVTVVVLPDAEGARPMPDERFLSAVDRQLERYRQICICTRAAPPRYVPVELSVRLTATAEAEEQAIRAALSDWLRPRAERIGRTVRRDDAAAVLQKLPGVLRVRRLEFRGLDQNGYVTAAGDFQIPQDGLPAPERINIALLRG